MYRMTETILIVILGFIVALVLAGCSMDTQGGGFTVSLSVDVPDVKTAVYRPSESEASRTAERRYTLEEHKAYVRTLK